MKNTTQSVLSAGSINTSRKATVHYEATCKGAIISKAQYDQMPEELKSQVEVRNRQGNEVTIEAEFDIIDDIIAWTVESDLPGSTGIELLFR
jgi:hypothetical protein